MASEPTLHGVLERAQSLARADASPRVDVRHLAGAMDPRGALVEAAPDEPLPLSAAARAVLRTAAELARRGSDDEQRAGIVPHIRTAVALHGGRHV